MRTLTILSFHTSPLAQPGSGDGGGMNVYVRELSAALARAGLSCDVYTRAAQPELPPVVAVEPGFRVLSVVTILVAIAMFWLARNLRRQGRWARRWVTALEAISLAASLLLMVLPIGAVRGPVPVLVNLMMPAAVLWLLLTRSGRTAFRKPAPSDVRGAA